MDERVYLEVYDRHFSYQGQVSPSSLTATRRHLTGTSTATFGAPGDGDIRDALAADGACVVVMLDGEAFLSGWVDSDAGDTTPGAPLEYEVTGFDSLLWDTLGWPVPGNDLDNQNVGYWRQRGPAETVLKAAVAANANRLGLPVTVAEDQGRGGNIETQLRFHPLIDRFQPQLIKAGIGVTVGLVEGQGLVVDCYEITEHAIPLDAESGVLTGGTWKRTKPTITRVLAGSQGEAEARQFWGPTVADWEDQSPRVIEHFIDARDVSDDEDDDGGDAEAETQDRMDEAIADGAASYDLSLELEATEEFAYRIHWHPGDIIPLQPRPDVTIPAQIGAAELSINTGVRIKPVVGSGDDPLAQALGPLIKQVRALGRAVRNEAVR